MEPLVAEQSPPSRPESAPESLPFCHDGFQGLSVTARAAHAEILHRAYSIWESKGSPEHSELADWLEAEAEVLAEE